LIFTRDSPSEVKNQDDDLDVGRFRDHGDDRGIGIDGPKCSETPHRLPMAAAVGNILHPVTPRDDPVGVARVIAESDAWTLIHVVIIFGLILVFLGLVAIGYSMKEG
jgi:hypothetical protein